MSLLLLFSVFVTNIVIFSFFRMLIGFTIGVSLPIILNILAEFLPTRNRSAWLMLVWAAFSFGNVLDLVIVLLIMPNYEHEMLNLVFLSLFIIISALNGVIFFFIEDSPRNLIIDGQDDEGLRVFSEMVKPVTELTSIQSANILKFIKAGDNESIEHNFSELFSDKLLWTTLNFTMIWVFVSMLFYGPILVYAPTIQQLGESDSFEILVANIVSSLASAVLMVIVVFFVEYPIFGLRNTSIYCYVIGLIWIICILIWMDKFEYLMAAYLALTEIGFISVTTIAVATYPTKIRDFALGYLYAMLRVGGFLASFIFLWLFKIDLMLPNYVALGLNIILIICILFVKAEPTGVPLDREIEKEADERKPN